LEDAVVAPSQLASTAGTAIKLSDTASRGGRSEPAHPTHSQALAALDPQNLRCSKTWEGPDCWDPSCLDACVGLLCANPRMLDGARVVLRRAHVR
jgi:hypothetical protein